MEGNLRFPLTCTYHGCPGFPVVEQDGSVSLPGRIQGCSRPVRSPPHSPHSANDGHRPKSCRTARRKPSGGKRGPGGSQRSTRTAKTPNIISRRRKLLMRMRGREVEPDNASSRPRSRKYRIVLRAGLPIKNAAHVWINAICMVWMKFETCPNRAILNESNKARAPKTRTSARRITEDSRPLGFNGSSTYAR